jgi:putative ABC transport system permease protein
MLTKIAWKSLCNRRLTALLTMMSVFIGVFTVISVTHIREQAKSSFHSTISEVDLIVGARTSPTHLLLYSIFRIGDAAHNIHHGTYERIASQPDVAWTIPIALGDSHRGYRVIGTNPDYFQHYHYGEHQPLRFNAGGTLQQPFDVVIGAAIARSLGYTLGQKIILSHGVGHTSFSQHTENPFTVVGILAATGTPVDQSLHVLLSGIDAIHSNGEHSHNEHDKEEEISTSITAVLIGLKSKMATFKVQREINDYAKEPLTAILPGVAMTQLWQTMSALENVLRLIAVLVLIASMLGLGAVLMASIAERRREIAVMRALGASSTFIFLCVQIEAIFIVVSGTALALLSLQLGLPMLKSALAQHYGLFIHTGIMNISTLKIVMGVLITTIVIAWIPSWSAYRESLHNGLQQRF